jgi:hypothetical protein
MTPKVSLSSLKDGRWHEYLIRFALGGLATVITGLISNAFGPAVGGVFLALPAIFCASATLIEKHEIRRKRDEQMNGRRRGQQAAAVDAAGAALGSIGMLAFAVCFALLVTSHAALAMPAASLAWFAAALLAWWGWRQLRRALRYRHVMAGRATARARRQA